VEKYPRPKPICRQTSASRTNVWKTIRAQNQYAEKHLHHKQVCGKYPRKKQVCGKTLTLKTSVWETVCIKKGEWENIRVKNLCAGKYLDSKQ